MSIREQFKRTEKLYHFTSYDTAKLILESNQLRFGRLNNMNDIHENDKLMFADANGVGIDEFPTDVLDVFYDEIYKYRQISLSSDSEKGDQEGFDLHQMWGLYAEKGEGVCLVFDKKELINTINSLHLHYGRMSYKGTKELESFCISNSSRPDEIRDEVESRLADFYFHKRIEWEHEQEFRVIKRCPNPNREEYLWLSHSLQFIIMSSKLLNVDEVKYSKRIAEMQRKAKDIPILIYGNGLLDYTLVSPDGEEIWISDDGYDVLVWDENCKLAL